MPEYHFQSPVPDGVMRSVARRAGRQRLLIDTTKNKYPFSDKKKGLSPGEKKYPFQDKNKDPFLDKKKYPFQDKNKDPFQDENKDPPKYFLTKEPPKERFVVVDGRQVLVLDDGCGTLTVKGYVERIVETPKGAVGDVEPVSMSNRRVVEYAILFDSTPYIPSNFVKGITREPTRVRFDEPTDEFFLRFR